VAKLKLIRKPVVKKLKLKRKSAKKLKIANPHVLKLVAFKKMIALLPKSSLVTDEPVNRRKPFKIDTSSPAFIEMKWKKYGGGQDIDHLVTSTAKVLIEKFGFEQTHILPTRHKIYKNRDGVRLIVLTDINFHNKKLSIYKIELRMARSPVSSSTG